MEKNLSSENDATNTEKNDNLSLKQKYETEISELQEKMAIIESQKNNLSKYWKLERCENEGYFCFSDRFSDCRGIINKDFEEVVPCRYLNINIEKIYDKWLLVNLGKKYGIFDLNWKEVIPSEYDEIELLNDFIIRIKQNEKYGLIDINLKEIFICEYDQIDKGNGLQILDNLFLIRKNGKYGIIEYSSFYEKVKIVIPCAYEKFDDWHYDGLCSRLLNKWGIINYQGQIIFPHVIDEFPEYHYIGNVFPFRIGDKYGLLNRNGTEFYPCICDEFGNWHDGLLTMKMNGKWGAINPEKDEIIPFIYDEISYYSNKVFFVTQNKKKGILNLSNSELPFCKYDTLERLPNMSCFVVSSDGKFGFIDILNQEIISCKFDEIKSNLYKFEIAKGIQIEAVKNIRTTIDKKHGCLNADIKEIIPCKYDQEVKIIRLNKDEIVYIVKLANKWGVLNYQGKEIVECICDSEPVRHGPPYIIFKINNKVGLITEKGNVIPCKYDNISYNYISDNHHLVSIENKFGIINSIDKVIVPIEYDLIHRFGEYAHQGCLISIEGRYGIINQIGKEIVGCEYDEIKMTRGGYIVKKNNKIGLIYTFVTELHNPTYYFLIPCKYDDIYTNSQDNFVKQLRYSRQIHTIYRVVNNGKIGLISEKGKIIVPCEYDEIGIFNNGKCPAILNGERVLINEMVIEDCNDDYDDW